MSTPRPAPRWSLRLWAHVGAGRGARLRGDPCAIGSWIASLGSSGMGAAVRRAESAAARYCMPLDLALCGGSSRPAPGLSASRNATARSLPSGRARAARGCRVGKGFAGLRRAGPARPGCTDTDTVARAVGALSPRKRRSALMMVALGARSSCANLAARDAMGARSPTQSNGRPRQSQRGCPPCRTAPPARCSVAHERRGSRRSINRRACA